MARRTAVLLNASNMDSHPVYPFAFIQVPAVARRAGVQVVCQDLLGFPREEWPDTIRRLQDRYQPHMLLITLRNTCSMVYADYGGAGAGQDSAYFPIAQTRHLIKAIRSITETPITVGGFGFSLLARELMPILQPDFGVFGGADEFFLYFEDVLSGNYGHVANLLTFQDGTVVANKRIYFPPAPEIEYTPQAIAEMLAFYEKFPEPGFQGAPVEIMRGCSHSCVFCSEPFVAGRQVQYRDPAVIMKEIELLAQHGVRELCMIMSELNPEGNEFILRLAGQIKAFNERQPDKDKIVWFGANYLLTFDGDDFRRLYDSGFDGGWFDITALDDENARAMRTPYRNETLIGRLQDYANLQRRGFRHLEVGGTKAGTNDVEETRKTYWSMFLGNPATTVETIRRTLAAAHEAGLDTAFDAAHIIRPLRVFDYEKPSPATLAVTFSLDENLERVPYQQTLPSFAYPPALLAHFGSEEAVEEMFTHISETYLSAGYKETRDWAEFLQREGTESLTGSAAEEEKQEPGSKAQKQIDRFLAEFLHAHSADLPAIGLPRSLAELQQMAPYSLAVILYGRWLSAAGIAEAICERTGIIPGSEEAQRAGFFVKLLLHRFNIRLLPEYRPLFVSDA